MWYVSAALSPKLTQPVIAAQIHLFHNPVSSQVMFAPLLTHQALSLPGDSRRYIKLCAVGGRGGLPNPAFSGRAGTVNQAD